MRSWRDGRFDPSRRERKVRGVVGMADLDRSRREREVQRVGGNGERERERERE